MHPLTLLKYSGPEIGLRVAYFLFLCLIFDTHSL